eukprot:626069-Amorphochlora_amoeboformis.AAC.3
MDILAREKRNLLGLSAKELAHVQQRVSMPPFAITHIAKETQPRGADAMYLSADTCGVELGYGDPR